MSRIYRLTTAPRGGPTLDYHGLLNDQQIAVVEAPPGPILVVAGAGSGKTRTLTWRVARLVHEGASPESILLLTFTNKAAREMLSRVEEVARIETRRLTGGTFHHVAHLVLREHAAALGYARGYSILDRERVVMKASRFLEELPAEPALCDRWQLDDGAGPPPLPEALPTPPLPAATAARSLPPLFGKPGPGPWRGREGGRAGDPC